MKPFIPSWLNQAGLSQADFRVYCCLASRADNKTGIAWPQAESIARDCCMARNTVWKSIKSLQDARPPLIRRVGKPFAGSNRYQVLVPIGANEIPMDAVPIGANQILQSAQMDSRQSAQMDSRECNPKKDIQRRISNKGDSIELPFSSAGFKEAWNEWEQHRSEIKKKLTPSSIKQQFKELSAMGEAEAIATIHRSIKNGWQGLFQTAATATGKPKHAGIQQPEISLPV